MLLFAVIWKTLGCWVSKAIEHFKQDLLGHPSSRTDDSGAEDNVDCRGSGQEILEGKSKELA